MTRMWPLTVASALVQAPDEAVAENSMLCRSWRSSTRPVARFQVIAGFWPWLHREERYTLQRLRLDAAHHRPAEALWAADLPLRSARPIPAQMSLCPVAPDLGFHHATRLPSVA
jgi:hypothetical protein